MLINLDAILNDKIGLETKVLTFVHELIEICEREDVDLVLMAWKEAVTYSSETYDF